jgi:aminopeptidase N
VRGGGLSRITYFLDRPDVMARYRTTLIADRERFPVLLSNGNRSRSATSGMAAIWSTWEDPFPKPSYLFALIAGDLSASRIASPPPPAAMSLLQIYVEPHNLDKCDHAMHR